MSKRRRRMQRFLGMISTADPVGRFWAGIHREVVGAATDYLRDGEWTPEIGPGVEFVTLDNGDGSCWLAVLGLTRGQVEILARCLEVDPRASDWGWASVVESNEAPPLGA